MPRVVAEGASRAFWYRSAGVRFPMRGADRVQVGLADQSEIILSSGLSPSRRPRIATSNIADRQIELPSRSRRRPSRSRGASTSTGLRPTGEVPVKTNYVENGTSVQSLSLISTNLTDVFTIAVEIRAGSCTIQWRGETRRQRLSSPPSSVSILLGPRYWLVRLVPDRNSRSSALTGDVHDLSHLFPNLPRLLAGSA